MVDLLPALFHQIGSGREHDETVWGVLVGSVPFHLVREGMDQMVAQGSWQPKHSQRPQSVRKYVQGVTQSLFRVVWAGTSMLVFFVLSTSLTGLALTYWYRDCDPMLTGAITRYDQVVPFYVGESLADVAGLRGLFLSGLVGASISTVSSVVNSQAATFYVDIVSPNIDLGRTQAVWVTHLLGHGSGHVTRLCARNMANQWPNAVRTGTTEDEYDVGTLHQHVTTALSGLQFGNKSESQANLQQFSSLSAAISRQVSGVVV
ncbi:hypothetical protein HPB49_026305 [Dermacentor silvarum]|nr:hypothetical protein HPB49_026305 [Dermacentor silvarum]